MVPPYVIDATTVEEDQTVTVPDEIRAPLDSRSYCRLYVGHDSRHPGLARTFTRVQPTVSGDTLRWAATDDGEVAVVGSQRYDTRSDLDPVDTDTETDVIEMDRECGRS